MTLKKTFLDTSETLARIQGALPRGHRLRDVALDFASRVEDPRSEQDSARVPGRMQTATPAAVWAAVAAEAWPGDFGFLLPPGGVGKTSGVLALPFLGGPPEGQGAQPRTQPQFVLDLSPARYKIEYWKAGQGLLAGVEIGTGPRLVISPPDDTALVVAVEALP